jgi:hypothetical protein
MALIAVGLVGFIGMRVVYMITNKRREKERANWTVEDFENERLSEERRGDRKKTFIYDL